jgi:hypothetical protein
LRKRPTMSPLTGLAGILGGGLQIFGLLRSQRNQAPVEPAKPRAPRHWHDVAMADSSDEQEKRREYRRRSDASGYSIGLRESQRDSIIQPRVAPAPPGLPWVTAIPSPLFFLPSGRAGSAPGRKKKQNKLFCRHPGWLVPRDPGLDAGTSSRFAKANYLDQQYGTRMPQLSTMVPASGIGPSLRPRNREPADPNADGIGTTLRPRTQAARTGNAASFDASPTLRVFRSASGNPNGIQSSSPGLRRPRRGYPG